MFKRILVPLDGSKRAERSIPVAAQLARISGGSIVLAQATTIPLLYETYGGSSYIEEVIDEEIKSAEDYLKTAASVEALAGIEVETSAIFGGAAQAILSIATMSGADLVVMTSHGKTGVKRWVQGSVAQKIARHSPVPVLVLQESETGTLKASLDGRSVRALVTLDGSTLALSALEPAAQLIAALSAPSHGALHLLRVLKPLEFDENKPAPDDRVILREQVLSEARTSMQAAVKQLLDGIVGDLKLEITWSVVWAYDAATAIVKASESEEDAIDADALGLYDLIAMATHGRTSFQHWMLGSVTERVLSVTRLPMLIVRPNEAAFQRANEEKVGRETPVPEPASVP